MRVEERLIPNVLASPRLSPPHEMLTSPAVPLSLPLLSLLFALSLPLLLEHAAPYDCHCRVTFVLFALGSHPIAPRLAPWQSSCLSFEPSGQSSSCGWKFLEYVPSAWESDWKSNLESRKMRVCELMYEGENLRNSIAWVSRNIDLMKKNVGESFEWQESADELYSRMKYEWRCDAKDATATPSAVEQLMGTKMEMMIEPLVGNTRDPFTMCAKVPGSVPKALADRNGWDSVQSKRHLLMGPFSPMRFLRPSADPSWTAWTLDRSALLPDPGALAVLQGRKRVLFDLGAALYGSWSAAVDAASTKFFVDNFQMRRGVNFTHIYAFEYTVNKPLDIWSQVPKEIVPYYHYINVGVEATIGGHFNPWTILQQIATPQDYVVIKLDIDSPNIENPLVDQLLATPHLLALVDEMTYEHHVHTPEMLHAWGNLPKDVTLTHTYSYFTKLRQAGVRMHSWP